jgi:hypothetical protein
MDTPVEDMTPGVHSSRGEGGWELGSEWTLILIENPRVLIERIEVHLFSLLPSKLNPF